MNQPPSQRNVPPKPPAKVATAFSAHKNNSPHGMPDPRILLAVVFITGACVWLVPPAVSLVLGFIISSLFVYWRPALHLPPRTIRRLVKFLAFWVLLKAVMQYAPLLWTEISGLRLFMDGGHFTEAGNAGHYDGVTLGQGVIHFLTTHSTELFQTGIFCVQLLTLVLLGLLVTGAYSATTLACAFNWFLRPLRFLGYTESWRLALALALLLQYIPRIFETLDGIRQGAFLRGLPSQGLGYWRMAIPRFFTILAEQTWGQAVAVASRNLDNATPWQWESPIPPAQILCCGLYALSLIASLIFGWLG